MPCGRARFLLYCAGVVPAAVGAADAQVQQEKLLAQTLVPHRTRALV